MGKGLSICIGNQKINTIKVSIDHIIDSIAASPANANDSDAWPQFLHSLWNSQIDAHDSLPSILRLLVLAVIVTAGYLVLTRAGRHVR